MPTINPTNLSRLRAQKKLTLQKLADLASVDGGTIHRIEKGRSGNVRNATAEKLAEALGTTVDVLCGPDVDEDDNKLFGRKSQMNFKMADDARNALNLVAMRYDIKPSHILHLAPFLFLWAAETSLKRRQKKLDEISALWGKVQEGGQPKYLGSWLTENYRGEEVMDAEQASIKRRDILGITIGDEFLDPNYEESEQNPMALFLSELAQSLGDLAHFNYWSTYWDQPSYELELEQAYELVGGNEAAARKILGGYAPLYTMPKDTRESGPDAIAEWAIAVGDQNFKEQFGDDLLGLLGVMGDE